MRGDHLMVGKSCENQYSVLPGNFIQLWKITIYNWCSFLAMVQHHSLNLNCWMIGTRQDEVPGLVGNLESKHSPVQCQFCMPSLSPTVFSFCCGSNLFPNPMLLVAFDYSIGMGHYNPSTLMLIMVHSRGLLMPHCCLIP